LKKSLLTFVAILVLFGGGAYLVFTTKPTSHRPASGPMPAVTFTAPKTAPVKKTATVVTVHVGELAPMTGTMTDQACDPKLKPMTLVIPALCIQGSLVSTNLRAGSLEIPADVHRIGTWGATLRSPTGTTLMAGHVNYVGQGNGALYDLAQVQPGMMVYATGASGDVTVWKIAGLAVAVKPHVPLWVFSGDNGPRRLAIVTCGGPLSYVKGWGWNYQDNIIATALPTQ